MEKINIKYFGEVAEKTGKTMEELDESFNTVQDLTEYLKSTYNLNGDAIKIAINRELASNDQPLNRTDEIAVLSPFAGG